MENSNFLKFINQEKFLNLLQSLYSYINF